MAMVDWVVLVLFEIVELFVEYEVYPKIQKTINNKIHLFSLTIHFFLNSKSTIIHISRNRLFD